MRKVAKTDGSPANKAGGGNTVLKPFSFVDHDLAKAKEKTKQSKEVINYYLL